ncbi:MAG: M14 family murein peptide amidase A [Pseudomonadota bacterium]
MRRLFLFAALAFFSAAACADPAVAEACRALGQKLASVRTAGCAESGLTVAAQSIQKRPILLRDYPAQGDVPAPRRVLLIGGIHGDELSSVSIVFQWMQKQLTHGPAQDFHWHVVPALNPDGLLKQKSTRVNARGVDLNRNFDTPDWRSDAQAYWEKRTRKDPRRNPGPLPESEPETRWLASEIATFKPAAVIQVHAPYGLLDFDGPRMPPRKIGFLNLRQLGTYPGSLGNYAGLKLNLPTITLELPKAGALPSATQIAALWDDLLVWLDQNVPAPLSVTESPR